MSARRNFSAICYDKDGLPDVRIYEGIWVGARVIWGECTTLNVLHQVHPRLPFSLNLHTHFHSLAILEDIRAVARVIWGQCTTMKLLHQADGHHRAPGTTLASYQGLITAKTILLPLNLFLTIYIFFSINRYAATYPSYYITTVWYYIIFQSYIIYRDFLIEPRFGE